MLPESVPRERRAPFDAARANPFSSLAAITRLKGVGALVAVIALAGLAQFLLHTTWPLYTEFRYGWTPLAIGASLFLVGVVMVLVQGLALPRLLRRLGEVRLVLGGLASAMLAYLGYGLATAGWVVMCIISVNLLAGAVGPTLQGVVSRSVDAAEQGRAMGALASLGSLTAVLAPLIGTPLLAQVSHLPAQDWRVGIVYYLAAALQALALGLAAWHFRHHPLRRASPAT